MVLKTLNPISSYIMYQVGSPKSSSCIYIQHPSHLLVYTFRCIAVQDPNRYVIFVQNTNLWEHILHIHKIGTIHLFTTQKPSACRPEMKEKNRNGPMFWSTNIILPNTKIPYYKYALIVHFEIFVTNLDSYKYLGSLSFLFTRPSKWTGHEDN
jgi:hypothetical protein